MHAEDCKLNGIVSYIFWIVCALIVEVNMSKVQVIQLLTLCGNGIVY